MGRTVVVGDSLGVGTLPYLQQVLGGAVHGNVKVGRSSADGVNQLAGLLRNGADRVILDLGTNDATPQQLSRSVRRAQQIAGNRPIFIPTLNGPNAAAKNATLRQLAGGNVHLVNWHYQSGGLLGPDGIHATGAGYQRRAQILAHSIGSAPTRSLRSPATIATGTAQPQGAQMGWLEDYLKATNAQSALLAAAKTGGTLAPDAGDNGPQATGPVGGSDVSNRVLLGRGSARHAVGGAQVDSPFQRIAANRGGKLMEGHDYGNGDVRWFARKNPMLLQLASQLAATQQLHGNTNAQTAVAGLGADDQERIRRLLGA